MDDRAQKIVLNDINMEGLATRSAIRPQAVEEYAERIREGEAMDPAVVFLGDDGVIRLAAGHHRKAAYELAGEPRMPCVVKQGDRWAAVEFGLRDNHRHVGERLSRDDKVHNVALVLREKPELSDRAIAELCAVSASTVSKYRSVSTVQIGQSADRVGRDGRVYDTTNLVRNPAPPPTPAAPKCGQDDPATPSLSVDVTELAEKHSADDSACVVAAQSCEPGKKRPTTITDPFYEVEWRLGVTKKAADELVEACPGPDYELFIRKLDEAGEILANWKREMG